MALLQAYFDESYGGGGPMCVAGYVFTKSNLNVFDRQWRRLLKRYGLPFFRMSVCAQGAKPFKKLSMEQRIAVETAAIGLIRKYAACGFAVTVDPQVFERVTKTGMVARLAANPYEFCVWLCVLMVRNWAEDHRGSSAISYVFETGHQHQSIANAMMNGIFREPRLREVCMCRSHLFMEKVAACGCQGADLLAWQWFTDHKRRATGQRRGSRKDLLALIEGGPRHLVIHVDELWLQEILFGMREMFGGGSIPRVGAGRST